MSLKILSTTRVTPAGGVMQRVQHASSSTGTDMIFAIFLPSVYSAENRNIPAIYWLSGLTCTDQNFCQKAGPVAFARAEKHGIAMIMPDTSPRGQGVPDDQNYDLGMGAGFYVDATAEPWNGHYKMESYVQTELPSLIEKEFGVGVNKRSICGHSMGGHGALTLAFKTSLWTSVSAFAPICHPTACPWGTKAFSNYFGSVEAGKAHDATEILSNLEKPTQYDDILIDEGTADEFGEAGQLLLSDFESASEKVGQKLTVRRQEGFDHSYYFIAAFIADHVDFHAQRLI